MAHIAGGGGVIFFASLRRIAYKNRYVAHPLQTSLTQFLFNSGGYVNCNVQKLSLPFRISFSL